MNRKFSKTQKSHLKKEKGKKLHHIPLIERSFLSSTKHSLETA